MITETVRIAITKPNLSFSDREKFINTNIQKIMENYKQSGMIVMNHNVVNKSDSHASVKFNLTKMVGR
jgi:hypothetical protein